MDQAHWMALACCYCSPTIAMVLALLKAIAGHCHQQREWRRRTMGNPQALDVDQLPNKGWGRHLPLSISGCLVLTCLSACSTRDQDQQRLVSQGNWIGERSYFEPEKLNEKFSAERPAGIAPALGLALAGGGTKAASFSMGVLQGLTETGLMDKVDIVSSVSGGGYASLWYFQLRQAHPTKPMKDFFSDCLPKTYQAMLPASLGSTPPPCPASVTNYPDAYGTDTWRYQNQLRGYPDLFAQDRSPFYRHAFDYRTTTEDKRVNADVAVIGLQSIALVPLNLLMNGVFDWERDVSMSRGRYDYGINRAYGAEPYRFTSSSQELNYRPQGNVLQGQELSFTELAALHEQGKAPLWIINATAGEDRSPWDFAPQKDFAFSSFEITPYGSGSGLYGYHRQQLPEMTPLQAVFNSAAFLDTQQKVATQPPLRNLVNLGLKVSTFSWGSSYRNTFSSANTDARYATHMALPWPLYYAHHFSPDPDSVFVHLSDGGQSENLGAYALIRRGVPNIIISDHAQDRNAQLGDLCRLQKEIKKQGLHLKIPGLNEMEAVCSDPQKGYDLFQWQHPVMLGCISSNGDAADSCTKPKTDNGSDYFARLFIIKPSLANLELKNSIRAFGTCKNSEDCKAVLAKACVADPDKAHIQTTNLTGQPEPWRYEHLPSCELIGFIKVNAQERGMASDGCPHFPQHATDMMTLDSSPWIYGAMRDLGSYYAKQINTLFINGEVDTSKFQVVLDYQKHSRLEARLISDFEHAHEQGDYLKCLAI
jgi:hypothetical protein